MNPANILTYIMLKTDKELTSEQQKEWFSTVKLLLPSGVISSIQTTDDHGDLRSAVMVHRVVADTNEYIVPLTRNLLDEEVEPVVEKYSEKSKLDFDIEVSSAQANVAGPSKKIEVDDGKYMNLCVAWAKKQHETWLKDRTNNGWSYGTSIDMNNKKHPLIRQWHELPDQFKKIDTEHPQTLIDLLNDQGYAVISKDELSGFLKLLRGSL